MKANFKIILIATILLLILSSCGEKNAPVENVKVGVLFPMSGDLADKGRDSSNGVILAIEEVNASGGVASLGGAKLEPIMGDSQGHPDIGSQETERLIQKDGVVAIIGAYQSSVTKPATTVAERLETPFIVGIAIADVITERGYRYTFRIQPKALYYARDQVRFLVELKELAGYPVKRVALLHENTDFGTATALAQKIALRESELELVAEVSYEAEGVTDLSQEVAEALAAHPDVILEVTYLKDSILIRQALDEAGSNVLLMDTAGGTVSPEYIQTLGPLAEGTLTVSEYSKYTTGGRELNERFRARFGVDITGDSAYAYQAVWVLKDALERAGAVDKEKLRDALAATNMSPGPRMILPAEGLRFDASGQNDYARLFIVQIQDGEYVPVWPPEYATAKMRLGE
jgi:branched-chain amino acid transport system substrate-binding protein